MEILDIKTSSRVEFQDITIRVKDIVKAMVAAATHSKTVKQTYFLTNPQNYSVKEMVKTMARGEGRPVGLTLPIPIFLFRILAILMELRFLFFRKKPIPSRDKVRDVAQIYWLCTPKKAKKDFDWEAPTTLEDGMKAMKSAGNVVYHPPTDDPVYLKRQ